MRIAFISANYRSNTIGGAQKSIELLVGGLRERGHETHVIKLSHDGRARRWQHEGAMIHELGRTNVYWPFGNVRRSILGKAAFHGIDTWNPLVFRQVSALCKELRPDVLHTNVLAGLSVSAWSAARRGRIPIVHTLRDYYLLCISSGMQRRGKPCGTRCVGCRSAKAGAKLASRHCNAVVGNSRYILDQHLAAGHFRDAVHKEVIFTGAEPLGVPPPLRTELLRAESVQLGFLGRLTEPKGVEQLIGAVNALGGRARLLVGGRGDELYMRALRDLADPALVEFCGQTTPAEFFPRIDALCVPSLWPEPLSRTIMEAYSYGLPVLSTDAGGSPEVVINGETGFVTDFSSRQVFGEVVNSLLGTNGAFALLAAGARRMGEQLGIDRTVMAYERLYRNVVGLPGAAGTEAGGSFRSCA